MLPLLAAVSAGAFVTLAVAGGLLLRQTPHPLAAGVRVSGDRSVTESVVRRIGRLPVRVAGSRLAPYRALVSRRLLHAGRNPRETEEFLELHAGICVVALVSSAWLSTVSSVPLALVMLVIVATLPAVRIHREARVRQAEVDRAMPAFLELLGVLLAAGMTFRLALARVVPRLDGPLKEEMEMLLTQLEFGWTPDEAFGHLLRRNTAPSVQRLVTTARQNLALGVPIAKILADLAEDMRSMRIVALKIRAEQAAQRATLLVVVLALPAALGLMVAVLVSELVGVLAQLGLA